MAAQQLKVRLKLNLLHSQGIPQKLPIRFLKWLVSYGRFIAVVVEIIVIVTFVIRFRYDAQLQDLNESINNNIIPYIKSRAATETEIRQTQFKLATIRMVFDQNPDWQGIMDIINRQIPPGVRLNSIRFDNSEPSKGVSISMAGVAQTNVDLASFLAGLKSEASAPQNSQSSKVRIKNIVLTGVTYQDAQISFTISGGT